MEPLTVKIVELKPMRVASTLGFSAGPEKQAWDRMTAWAQHKGLWKDGTPRRFFGFDTSSPSEGSPNYGYEVWMTVGPEVDSEGEITVKTAPGGLYAVTRVEVKDPWKDIPRAWQQLIAWVETSPYRPARHQCLEETFWEDGPNYQTFTLELYLPVLKS
jgi:DNA gyrase inhibitor GyrI